MNWTFMVGMTCGVLSVVAVEAIIIIVWTFKGIKNGILNEASKVDTEEV